MSSDIGRNTDIGGGGEATTAQNVGTGQGKVFRDKVIAVLNFKSLLAGAGITINNLANEVEIIASGVQVTASNLGTGVNVFKQKLLGNLEFRSLLANAEILIAENADDLSFSIGAIAQSKITGLVAALATKLETISNVGLGATIAKAKVGTNVDLKSLTAGTNINLVQNADDIEISAVDTQATASNVGTGVNVFLQKLLGNFEFRTLLANAEVVITQNALDLAFSIGAIAQAKITGLVTALGTKLETITNVGGEKEIAKAKVGQNVDLRTLKEGTNITITQNADDLEISAADTQATASNVGTGVNVFLQKLLGNFEFRTLLANAEVLIVQNAQDLAFSIGAIAQSKITGLVTALSDKIESITNVGGFNELIKAKVGTNVDVRTIQAGTNITIVQNADDIEISSTDTGEANTASNEGTGVNVFLQKLGVNLEFRTLLANAEVLIVQNAQDLAFSIGAIAQSKITGLVAALLTKLETLSNDGTGEGISKAKVGTDNPLKSLVGGTGITLSSDVNEITITNDNPTPSGEDNTASNVGTGVNVFLQKLGVDLEFRTLLANAEVLIVQNAQDLAFSIGAIAQSKITGLVAALATKIDTIVNVGTGVGQVFRDKVGTTLNLKTLLAGTGITITNNADDITIEATAAVVPPSYLANSYGEETIEGSDFLAVVGNQTKSGTEIQRQTIIPSAGKLKRMTLNISSNSRSTTSTFNFRKNSVNGNQTISIPATTTGTFKDTINTDDVASDDLINYEIVGGAGGGAIDFVSASMEVIAQ